MFTAKELMPLHERRALYNKIDELTSKVEALEELVSAPIKHLAGRTTDGAQLDYYALEKFYMNEYSPVFHVGDTVRWTYQCGSSTIVEYGKIEKIEFNLQSSGYYTYHIETKNSDGIYTLVEKQQDELEGPIYV